MSALAEHYREVNFFAGHARNCASGAGADCDCGKFDDEQLDRVQWGVSVEFSSGERYCVDITTSHALAVESAKRHAKAGWAGVVTKRLNTVAELERAEMEEERVRDWASD